MLFYTSFVLTENPVQDLNDKKVGAIKDEKQMLHKRKDTVTRKALRTINNK